MRRTRALRKIAEAFMADPTGRHWGYDLSRRADVRSGVLYPVLRRMHDAGWLEDDWEDQPEGRPRRRYYVLTDLGRQELAGITSTEMPKGWKQ